MTITMTTDLAPADLGIGRRSRGLGAPLLTADGLCVEYRRGPVPVRAISDADLVLHRGQVLGLTGESGSGKSTLAYAITRLLRPPGAITSGRLLFHPEPALAHAAWLWRDSSLERSAVDLLAAGNREPGALRWSELAVVIGSAGIDQGLTIQAQLAHLLRARRPWWNQAERRARTRQLAELAGLPLGQLGSFPHELRGRMRERLTIAMALAHDPQVVIVDDLDAEPELAAELTDLRDLLGLAIVLISRDVRKLAGIADVIALLHAGRIVV